MGPHRFGGPPWGRDMHVNMGEMGFARSGFGRGFGGFPGGPRGGGRMRRGDVRGLLLDALAEGPGHGYDLIGRLEGRSGGRWRPSPGSVYPTLQLLEEEGLLSSEDVDGKKVYSLTEAGQAAVAERAERGEDPWAGQGDHPLAGLRSGVAQLAAAAWQVGQNGRPELVDQATQIVNDARKRLYELLAQA